MLIQLANYFNVSIDYLLGQLENDSMINKDRLENKILPFINQKEDKIFIFHTTLKTLREKHNLSQYKLADMLGVSQSTVGMWESGKNKPEYANLVKLADIFNVSIGELAGSEEDKKIPLTEKQGDKILKDTLDKLGFLDENGVITEEVGKMISEFILNNSDMLRKLLNDKK